VGAGNGITVADDSVAVVVDDVTLKINASAKVAAKIAAIQENGTELATAHQIYTFVTGQGYTSNVGDITQVLAGNGLTGGGDSGALTLTVVGGDGITANSDEIEVTVDDTTIELSASDGDGTVRAKTETIADGGTALATADQIHTFVTGIGYTSNSGTLTGVTAGTLIDVDTTTAASPSISVDLSELTDTTTLVAETDRFVVLDNGSQNTIDPANIPLSVFDGSSFTAEADGGNADTLGDQLPSYYLNTSTTFGGEVSGTYNNLSVGTLTNLTMTGILKGPENFTIDPADADGNYGNNNGTLIIKGNLQIDGTTTTVNSTTLDVDDLNITVAKGAANAAAANGAGITVDVGTNDPVIANPTITYKNTDDTWNLNKDLVVAGGTGTIEGTDLSNARILAGTTAAGLGIDSNEIAVKGDHLYIETIDAKDISFRTSGTNQKMIIKSGGNVGIGIDIPKAKLQVEELGIDTLTTAVETTDETVIDSFVVTDFRSAKYTVQITQGTNYQVSEVLVLHDGSTASATEFAKLETNGVLGTINTDINGTAVRLKVTMSSASASTVKIVRHCVTV